MLLVASFAIAALHRSYVPFVVFVATFIALEALALLWLPLAPATASEQRRKSLFAVVLLALVVGAMAFALLQR